MKTLIIAAGLFLSLTQVACAANGGGSTTAAPIVETVSHPDDVTFNGLGRTTYDIVAADLEIIEDTSVDYNCGRPVEKIIAEDLQITDGIIEAARPLDSTQKVNRALRTRDSRRLVGSL